MQNERLSGGSARFGKSRVLISRCVLQRRWGTLRCFRNLCGVKFWIEDCLAASTFSHQAGEDLARATGTSPKDYEILNRLKTQKTRRYIELLLAAGGEMAWDPLWPGGDQLRIESPALAWILQEEKRAALHQSP